MIQANYQCFAIRGSDAKTFLQGQFTNDFNTLDGAVQAAAYCSAEGKILGFFFITQWQDSYLLLTNDTNPNAFIDRLKMFVLRSEVYIEPTDLSVVLNVTEQPPALITFSCNGLNYAVIEPTNVMANTAADDWQQWECAAFVPQITDNIRNQIIAPFYNLDLMHSIAYDKGCYVGQEPIARLHFRSKPSKRCMVYRTVISETLDWCEGKQLSLSNEQGKPVRCQLLRYHQTTQEVTLQLLMNVKQLDCHALTLDYYGSEYVLQQLPPPFAITPLSLDNSP